MKKFVPTEPVSSSFGTIFPTSRHPYDGIEGSITNYWGNVDLNKCRVELADEFVNNSVSYKEYMKDVAKNTNGIIWIVVIPIASIIYWIQRRHIINFRNKHPQRYI